MPSQYIKRCSLQACYRIGSRGVGAQSVTVKSTGYRFDPHSRRWNIYLHLYFYFFALVSRQSATLSSAIQHAMPPELGGKWGTECLNTRFLLPILLRAIQREADLIFDVVMKIWYSFLITVSTLWSKKLFNYGKGKEHADCSCKQSSYADWKCKKTNCKICNF